MANGVALPIENVVTDTWSGGYLPNAAGVYAPFAANELAMTDLGYWSQPNRINSLDNNSMIGAVVGSPGTRPTNWSLGTFTGLTQEIVGLGTEDGLPYMDYRVFGTPGFGGPVGLFMMPAGAGASAVGQTWTSSLFLKVIAAPAPPVNYRLRVAELDASNVSLNSYDSIFVPSGSKVRYTQTRVLVNATVAFLRMALAFGITSGVPVDFTVRLYAPQLEQGAFATQPILTNNTGAKTRTSNRAVLDLTGKLALGVAGFLRLTVLGSVPFGPLFQIDDGTSNNRLYVEYGSTDGPRINAIIGGGAQTQSTPTAVQAVGTEVVLAFAFSNGLQLLRQVGGTQVSRAFTYPAGLMRLSLGVGVYCMYELGALKFGAQSQATFDAMYERAVAAA